MRDRGNSRIQAADPGLVEQECARGRDGGSGEVADAEGDRSPVLGVAAAHRTSDQVGLHLLVEQRAVDNGKEIFNIEVVG
jgi:hypothetical protein